MNIAGFEEISTIEYPGEVASVIYTSECNLRCPFCYNHRLVNADEKTLIIGKNKIISRLKENKLITAAVITGGEPTIQWDLIPFMRKIKKETGLKIKLFTNGINYIKVMEAIPYIDALSVDFKTIPSMYKYLGASHNQVQSFCKLVTELKTLNINLEFRCTLAPWLTDDSIVAKIKELISPYKLITQVAQMDDILDPSFFLDRK